MWASCRPSLCSGAASSWIERRGPWDTAWIAGRWRPSSSASRSVSPEPYALSPDSQVVTFLSNPPRWKRRAEAEERNLWAQPALGRRRQREQHDRRDRPLGRGEDDVR